MKMSARFLILAAGSFAATGAAGSAYSDAARVPAKASAHHSKAVPGKAAGAIGPVVPFGYGINIHEASFSPSEYKLYHQAGFGLVRFDFHWQDVERTPGVYDFKNFDVQLAQMKTLGVHPLWILDYTNTSYDNNQPPHTKEGLRAFASFAHAAAAHYRNCGVIWEIWNEPNEPIFWSTGPSADRYAALVKATVPAIRAADPAATILAGAVSRCSISYITAFLKNNPLKGVSALSVHPYREGQPESVINEYAAVRSLIAKHTPSGQPQVPIVCSEWGYTTATGQASEALQARYITRVYLTNLLCGVNMTINYDWTDDGSNPADNEQRYGILNQDLTPKPAYTAISTLLNTLHGYEFRHRIRGKNSADYTLLFQGPRGLARVAWTSDDTASAEAQTPHVTLIGKRDARYAHLLRLALATASPDDLPYPNILPQIPGIVLVLTSRSPPLPLQAASDAPASGHEALVNGGFEAGATGWTASTVAPGQRLGITDAVAHTGTVSAFMSAEPSAPASWFNWGQTALSVTPGDEYAFTWWLKKEDVQGQAGWFIHVSDAGGQMLYNQVLTAQIGSTWEQVTRNFTIPPGGIVITIGTVLYGSGAAYFDDASLVKTAHKQ